MKISKTITQAFVILSIAVISLPSCKEKRGCTDTDSPNYDPEATMYEFGSCEPANIYGTYTGSVKYTSDNCGSYNNQPASITVYESVSGYVTLSNILGAYTLELEKQGSTLFRGSYYISSSYPYETINSISGTIKNNHLALQVSFYDYECENQLYNYYLNK